MSRFPIFTFTDANWGFIGMVLKVTQNYVFTNSNISCLAVHDDRTTG